eukprot:TRINITY_DN18653_c0_g1_i2.p1 TRINITY_DN18653_c0_g1~~TRINITY_DN18653_c0_g1_i2.p1  ORF type:complete len:120 (-),score=8.70 TRINITY_DN18653_c0_g1_i2:395-754(-)
MDRAFTTNIAPIGVHLPTMDVHATPISVVPQDLSSVKLLWPMDPTLFVREVLLSQDDIRVVAIPDFAEIVEESMNVIRVHEKPTANVLYLITTYQSPLLLVASIELRQVDFERILGIAI